MFVSGAAGPVGTYVPLLEERSTFWSDTDQLPDPVREAPLPAPQDRRLRGLAREARHSPRGGRRRRRELQGGGRRRSVVAARTDRYVSRVHTRRSYRGIEWGTFDGCDGAS